MKKRGYEQSVQRESADSSVYDDGEDGGMLATSRDAAARAKAYEGKQPHPARWVCGTILCTLLVVFIAIWLGSGTETGRDVLNRMAQGDGADYMACVQLPIGKGCCGSVFVNARLNGAPADIYTRYHAQFVDRASDANPDAENIRSNLRDLTMKPHIAGSLNDLETAECVHSHR
jgi:hypothetical protein